MKNKQITRDIDNRAIINIYNEDKVIVGHTIVDDDKWHELSRSSMSFKNEDTYVMINNTKLTLHRYLLNANEDQKVDHINGNGLDNRIENLRFCTDTGNSHNKNKISKTTKSKYKGVVPVNERYQSRICFNHHVYILGTYDIEDIAALAYNIKAKELYGEFANINDINLDNKTHDQYKEIIKINLDRLAVKKNNYNGVTLNKKLNKYASQIMYKKKISI